MTQIDWLHWRSNASFHQKFHCYLIVVNSSFGAYAEDIKQVWVKDQVEGKGMIIAAGDYWSHDALVFNDLSNGIAE